MNTQMKKRTAAASTAVLLGSGLVAVAVPAHATQSAPTAVTGVAQAQVGQLTRAAAPTAVIVHRGGQVAGRASISAAPKLVHTKKKVKKKYRSRRS